MAKLKKVLYLTLPSFFDLEISLIRELSKLVDIIPIVLVSNRNNHLSAFDMDNLGNRTIVASFSSFPELSKYRNLIDLDRWILALNPDDSIKGNLLLMVKILRIMRKERFDIIHTTSDCRLMLMLLPFMVFRRHTLLTVHDPIAHESGAKAIEFIKRNFSYRVYKNVLLLSKALEKEFVGRYCNNTDRIRIFYSRLGPYDFLRSYPQTTSPYGRYILYYGRISAYKGVDLLIDGYLNSSAPLSGIKLVIAGAGDIKNERIVDSRIVVLNRYIKNEELAALISNCLFSVLPYRSATQSGVLMSAFAFNKPALVTSVGDLPETVKDDLFGKIIEPNSIDAISDGIDKMLGSDLKSMEDKISASFNNNGGRNSWEQIAKDMMLVYDSL